MTSGVHCFRERDTTKKLGAVILAFTFGPTTDKSLQQYEPLAPPGWQNMIYCFTNPLSVKQLFDILVNHQDDCLDILGSEILADISEVSPSCVLFNWLPCPFEQLSSFE